MSGMNFWSRVENLRKKKGYSRKELAAIANINLSNFSKGIKDGSLPSAKTAVKLAQYLDTSTEYLVTGHDISKTEINLLYKYSDFLHQLDKLSSENRYALKIILEDLNNN